MKELISFLFTDSSWEIVYKDNGEIKEVVFDILEEAEEFSIENDFNLNFRGCPIL